MNSLIIRKIIESDISMLLQLHEEFEGYLKSIDANRISESMIEYKKRITKHAFSENKYFTGFIALDGIQSVGYILYHIGYDPDEMKGPVIYIIDLYVTELKRHIGIGKMLIDMVRTECKNIDGICTLIHCWNKNKKAIKFYDHLGCKRIENIILYSIK